MENLIGKIIDNYRIVSVLGKGGMGIVYKAYDTKLDRYVAIKMLHASVLDKQRFVERFKREAKNHAKLTHPNIVTVYGFIEYSNLLGIVMEYVEGESLEKVIDRQGRFNVHDVIYILKQLLLGMAYAHSKGFVHRDIKPSNIILNKEGVTKIMDFGISKSLFDSDMTKTGSKIGTVYYMSPEQIKSAEVTNRSDIYSIGCTVYEMILGLPPYDSQSEYEVMDGHLKKTIPKISDKIVGVPDQLDKSLQRAMQKSPTDRYTGCEEMLEDVQEAEKQLSKMQTSYFSKTPPRTTKYKIISASAFLGITIALITLAYFVFHQVKDLIESNQLDKFKKYNIQSLFKGEDKRFQFSQLTRIPSGVLVNLNSIHIAEQKYYTIAADSGIVLSSLDGGATWKNLRLPYKASIGDVYVNKNGRSFIVGDSSSIFVGNKYLDSLKQVNVPKGFTFFKVKFVNDKEGIITGTKGIILKTKDSGSTWNQVKSNTNEIIFDCDFFDTKRGFAVGWNGTILSTTNGGESWYNLDLKLTDNYLKSIDLTETGYGLIVGGDGTILRTSDYGNNWEKLNLTFSGGFQKVKFISDEYSMIAGSKGVIMVSKDKGETWNVLDSKVYSNLNSFGVDPYGKIFIISVNGIIYKIQ